MDFSTAGTAFFMLVAAAVADYRAVTEELVKKTAKLYTVLGAAFTSLAFLYVDRIVIK